IQGSSTTSFLYLGDRWAGAWGGRVNDSTYVWLPLTFSTNTSLSMSWRNVATIDTATGALGGSTFVFKMRNANNRLGAEAAGPWGAFRRRTVPGSCSTRTTAAPTRNGGSNTTAPVISKSST